MIRADIHTGRTATGLSLTAVLPQWDRFARDLREKCRIHTFSVGDTIPIEIDRLGAGLELELVWNIADTLNGFMAIPNLVALLGLSGVVYKLTKEHFEKEKLGV